MANRYKQVSNTDTESHFSAAVTGELAFSRMVSTPTHLTTFNAGDIVPIYCLEVLPHDTISIDEQFVIRQTTLLTPTMGQMVVDFYAFFVPNRVVNESWKTVMGENVNGSWTAPEINLAPLFDPTVSGGISPPSSIKIPVGSVADYYGFPTQQAIPSSVLSQMHDLKFRGYVEIYNEFFRDQNYQPPIAYSKLNVYNDFLHAYPAGYSLAGSNWAASNQDNSYGAGAVSQAVFGNLQPAPVSATALSVNSSSFNALGKPLKANKLHDQFTSVLPSPQKGGNVLVPLNGLAPLVAQTGVRNPLGAPMQLSTSSSGTGSLWLQNSTGNQLNTLSVFSGTPVTPAPSNNINGTNLFADLSNASSATIAELRTAAAIQQVYESLARCGSRYREYVRGFFGLEVDDPYKDIPTYLGHFRRDLELYQTAQTSATEDGSPQGTLAAFGYTANSGHLFRTTFLEHGYVHIFAVVRHKNVYSSFLSRDNFRLSMLDWYQPPLANISEQPLYTREINPFYSDPTQVFGYQEAWYEYRYDPDYVTGEMRPGGSSADLSVWTYADDFAPGLSVSTGSWLQSNSQVVLDRSLAVKSSVQPQLKGQFMFRIDKERPMPTYSLPGLDIF